MGKSKKQRKAEEEEAAAAAAAAEARAAAEAKAAEAKAAAEAAEMERMRAEQEAARLEQERVAAENERKMQQDRAEKEALVRKLQAVHRGRAARRAAKAEADDRHADCEVRQRVHKKSTAMAGNDGLDLFEAKKRDKDYSSADDNVVADRSLFCLGEESGIRHTFNEILDHKVTSACLMGCILLNVFILAIETPTNTFSDDTRATLALLDVILSIIFSSKQITAMATPASA